MNVLKNNNKILSVILAAGCFCVSLANAQDGTNEEEELAKKTQNPIASMVSLPLQYNLDFGIGSQNATRQTLNIQPVMPFSLGDDWNLIVRTILPMINAQSPVQGGKDLSGMGDISQSFFFSPKQPVNGWILGAGPIVLYPSATDDALGSEKWGAGPTVIGLKQESGWTYGVLANHIFSFAGPSDRDEVNTTFLQPFLSKTTKSYTTFGINTESTYEWEHNQWTVPINASITQLLKIGSQPMSLQIGYRYYAEKADRGSDWGLRTAVTFLFPK